MRPVPFELEEAEERFQAEPALTLQPVNAYDRHWARTVLASALEHLAGEYHSGGRGAHFAQLRPFLGLADVAAANHDATAASLGTNAAAVRQSVHRLRERFRKVVRGVIADTLAAPDEAAIDAELDALREALVAG